MAAVRLSQKQAQKLAFVPTEPPKTKAAKKPRKPAQEAVSVAVGEKWTLRRRLDRDNPPPVGTVCAVWRVLPHRVFLDGVTEEGVYLFDVSREQLAAYFSREGDTE